MKTSMEALTILIKDLGDEWQQILDNYIKEITENLSEEMNISMEDFLDAYKEDIISNNAHELRLVEKKIDNNLLYNNIHNHVREQLKTYYMAAPLRSLAAQDANKAAKTINDIFEKAILRTNPKIVDEYEVYGFASGDAMVDVLNIFISLCSFIAETNLHRVAIEDLVYNTFRFPKKLCKQISDIIDTNLQQIKINYIIDRLKEFE